MSQKFRISISQAIAAQAPLPQQIDIEEAIERSKQHESGRKQSLVDAFSIGRQKSEDRRKRKNAKAETLGPTPERAKKAAEGSVVVGQQTKAHTVQSLLDRYRNHIPAEIEAAARQLLHDFLLAETGGRITSAYGGVGGSVPGARHGGVQDYVREANATVELIRAEFPKRFIDIIDAFITETTIRSDGSAIRLEDAGRTIVPGWSSPDAQKGAGWGLFYSVLLVAQRFYDRQRALGRLKDPPTPEAVRRLHTELTARAQARREREGKRIEAERRRKG